MAEHDRIIAAAAKLALSPLGFRRKGRSRVWYADRGYWLSIVEFQPSGFAKGSYLNVAAHWLWTPHDYISFDHMMDDVRTFIAFEDADQFSPLTAQQAADAVVASERLRSAHPDLASLTDFLIERDAYWTSQGRPDCWESYHAAICCGLTGRRSKTRSLLSATRERFAGWRPDFIPLVDELEAVAGESKAFKAFVHTRIDSNRARFGLSPLATVTTP